MNYFELFDLPPSLSVDGGALRRRYFELSRQQHPDYFVNADEAAQQQSLEMSALLNRGLKVLGNREETIRYVLLEEGLMEEEEKYSLPQDFLMEMLDLNEAISDAAMEGDAAQKAALKEKLSQYENEIYEPVRAIVETSRESLPSKEALLQVKDYYYKKKYLQRLSQQLEGML